MKTVTRKILMVAAIIVFVTTIVPMVLMASVMLSLMLDEHLAQQANYNYKAVSAALTQLTFTLALVVLFGARAVSGSWRAAWIMAGVAVVLAPPFCVLMKWLGV
jgi:hypothetical protein